MASETASIIKGKSTIDVTSAAVMFGIFENRVGIAMSNGPKKLRRRLVLAEIADAESQMTGNSASTPSP
ncbi:hypothetical protein J2S97_000154 [Arthrobacter oryzae]|nr:hypothetical protein [Arthrobacter oryzae]